MLLKNIMIIEFEYEFSTNIKVFEIEKKKMYKSITIFKLEQKVPKEYNNI